MNPTRRIAVVTGVFFLITEVAAIAGLVFYQPVLDAPAFVSGHGADQSVYFGALSEIILTLAIVGTAVALFPVIRGRHEGLAVGYVCGRLMEAAVIVVGIIALLGVVTLRHDLTSSGGASSAEAVVSVAVAKTLVAIHNWTFLFGPNFALGVNTTSLAVVMFRSRLVPRLIAVLGLIGGPLIFVSATAVLFGLYTQTSTWGAIAGLPVLAWELSFAVRLLVKGFDVHALDA